VLIRLNQIMRGSANYFKHAVAKHTFKALENFAWRQLSRMLMQRHHWKWTDVCRRLVTPTGQWRRPSAEEIELFNVATVSVTRYRYATARCASSLPRSPLRARGIAPKSLVAEASEVNGADCRADRTQ
jgi:RNA-directed DNA polymerase